MRERVAAERARQRIDEGARQIYALLTGHGILEPSWKTDGEDVQSAI